MLKLLVVFFLLLFIRRQCLYTIHIQVNQIALNHRIASETIERIREFGEKVKKKKLRPTNESERRAQIAIRRHFSAFEFSVFLLLFMLLRHMRYMYKTVQVYSLQSTHKFVLSICVRSAFVFVAAVAVECTAKKENSPTIGKACV